MKGIKRDKFKISHSSVMYSVENIVRKIVVAFYGDRC